MKVFKNSDGLPTWLDSLAGVCSKAFGVKEEEITAEMHVKNLPTVTWKDETFYVDITNDGAILYNAFGNIVQQINDVKSIEEVDSILNEHAIVAENQNMSFNNNDIFEEQDTQETTQTTQQQQPTYPDAYAPTQESQESQESQLNQTTTAESDPFMQELLSIMEKEEQITSMRIKEHTQDFEQLANVCDSLQKQEVSIEDIGCDLSNVSEVMADSKKLKKRVREALTPQQYAYSTDTPAPGSLDLGSQEAEVEHFNETAQNTKKRIDYEHQLDMSTQTGRIALLNYDFLDDIFGGELEEDIKNEIVEGIEAQLTKLLPVTASTYVLNEKEAEMVHVHDCPICNGKHTLSLEKAIQETDKEAYISCEACNAKYIVDIATSDIRVIKGRVS